MLALKPVLYLGTDMHVWVTAPELASSPQFTPHELKELMAFTRSRDYEVVPAINGASVDRLGFHWERDPTGIVALKKEQERFQKRELENKPLHDFIEQQRLQAELNDNDAEELAKMVDMQRDLARLEKKFRAYWKRKAEGEKARVKGSEGQEQKQLRRQGSKRTRH
ncbi:hypothetical protein MMC25_002145 [Agyrium rufum]|nr:hypothetical protein [Agyrium rufum]